MPRGAGVRVGETRGVARKVRLGKLPPERVDVGRGVLVGGMNSGDVMVALGAGVRVAIGWTVTISAARSVVGDGVGDLGGGRVGSPTPSDTATIAAAGTGEAVGGGWKLETGGAQPVLTHSTRIMAAKRRWNGML